MAKFKYVDMNNREVVTEDDKGNEHRTSFDKFYANGWDGDVQKMVENTQRYEESKKCGH